ncbi:probable serine/threonine-protein kinase DDB_G0278901 [Haliotis cracherodii]|uniref:probable serine/threonine-protein kinase DDB_G0278901 n=1 Tax=Haliotis cracherodii TaxID=6455 RepID=UPI0039EAC02A
MSSAANGVSTSGADRNQFFEEDLLQKDTFEEDAEHLKELFKDISHFHSLRNVPESLIEKVVQLTCTPFLKGGYSSGLCFLSSLRESPEYCAGQPIQNLEQCMGQCRSKGRTAVGHTDSSTEREEDSTIQMQRDLWYREECCMRLEQFPVSEDNPTNEDDFMGDLSFTDNCPDDRAESSHSVLHDDFSHEDDILDIPTLSILSTPRASLGQAFHNNHDVSSPALSTPDHVEAKPASHEPFPSEYVFKRVCGPSFSMSSEFWHIKIPTLPSHMVDYKVEPDGLTEIVIGSGSFGEVYAATLTVSPGQSRDVVVKQHFTDRTTQEAIANEAKITMYLESTGCVPICYGLLSDEEEGYNIVMEYVGSGQTLRDVMCESDMPRLHWLNIACQLVNGLKKIHKKEVLINDIKSDNILVDISGELPSVKFCDMGTASYKSGVTYRGDMENCFHLAPEACAHAKTTPACDVYSLGRVLKKIHGASHISALLSLSDMCMAEDPAVRPTLLTINQRLQEEYINEALFPTLTVPSHGYLDSIHEEPEEESAGSVLKVNTPIDKDLPTATGLSSAEVNGAVSRDGPPSRSSNRSNRIGQHELGTSVAEAYPDEIQDIYSISIDHVPRIHVSVSSEGHTIPRVNMPNDILYSAEITDTSAGAAKSAQNETPVTNTNAATSKSAQDGSRTLVNNMNTSSSKSTRNGNGSLDAIPAVGTCEVSASFNSPNGSYGFHTQTVPTSPPPVTTPTPASPCASCHFHTTSASLELFSAVVSPKVSSARETPDAASSELQTSSSHSLDTSSDTFVDAAKDQSDADANSEGRRSDADVNEAAVVPAVAAVDVNETSSSLEAPHVAAYRALCQAELEVYNKHWEDTPVYEGYLPLVMSLLMLILGILGFI